MPVQPDTMQRKQRAEVISSATAAGNIDHERCTSPAFSHKVFQELPSDRHAHLVHSSVRSIKLITFSRLSKMKTKEQNRICCLIFRTKAPEYRKNILKFKWKQFVLARSETSCDDTNDIIHNAPKHCLNTLLKIGLQEKSILYHSLERRNGCLIPC